MKLGCPICDHEVEFDEKDDYLVLCKECGALLTSVKDDIGYHLEEVDEE